MKHETNCKFIERCKKMWLRLVCGHTGNDQDDSLQLLVNEDAVRRMTVIAGQEL
jgi:hypothetical protein